MDKIDLHKENALNIFDHSAFVGRNTKLARLTETFAYVQEGHACIMSIKGESGIGKTRVATEFLEWAGTQKANIIKGRAFEDGGKWPFLLLVETLEQYYKHNIGDTHGQEGAPDPLNPPGSLNDINDLNEIIDRVLVEMHSYIFHQFTESGQGKTEYKRLCASFTLLGQALAEHKPVVMFIDDIHWSDFASLEMLQYASRRWIESNTPILILLSLRTEALVLLPTFANWLTHLEHDLQAASFILNPLQFEDTIDFLHAIASEESPHLESFGRWLYTETGGQPFYMVELLKMLFEHGLLRMRERENSSRSIDFEPLAGNISALEHLLLPGARAVIALQLKKLSPQACLLANAAAVLGQSSSFAYLCYVSGLNEQESWDALNELLARHIFYEEAQYYFFMHEKVCEVAYIEIPEAQRMELHSRALEMLYNEPVPITFQAYHAHAAGLYEQAFHLYIAAGDTALSLIALHDAVAFYESAIRLLVEQQVLDGTFADVPTSTIEHLYLQAGHIYETLNAQERSWATYQSMFLLAKRMNITTLISVALCQLATGSAIFNVQEQARLLFQEAIDSTDDLAALAENTCHLAQFNFYRFDAEAASQHSSHALQLARKVNTPELLARALSTFADALMLASVWEEVEVLVDEARVFYQELHDPVMDATCLVQIAQIRFNQGQPLEAVSVARAAHLAFIQADYNWGRIYVTHHLVTALLDVGAYSEALSLAQEALALAQNYAANLLLCLCLLAAGRVQRILLDPVAAYNLHHTAMSTFSANVPPSVMELLTAELCADCALAGEWAEAQSYATQALTYRSNSTFLYAGLTRWYETEILVRTGYNERATLDTEQFGRLIAQSKRYRIPHLRSLAVLALWRGEFDLTHLYLQEAAELAQQCDLMGELWSIQATRGDLYLAQGNKNDARLSFEHAYMIVSTLAERIEDESIRTKFLAAQQVQHVMEERD